MAKAPAYQMYAQDFDMDTASWPNIAVGIYQRLLNYEWVNSGLPKDLRELARIAREKQKKFDQNWNQFINQKFHENGNGLLINNKMENVRQTQVKYSESRRKNVSVRYKDKPTYEPTHEEHMNLHTPCSSSSSSSLNNKNLMQLFDNFWELYPARDGRKLTKKESLQFFKDKLRDEKEIELLLIATKNYADAKTEFIRDAIRFLKKDFWRDWVGKIETQKPKEQEYENVTGQGEK